MEKTIEIPSGPYTPRITAQGTSSHTGPLIIIAMLFFIWRVLTSLNDILIPHLKAVYTLSYVQAMLVQFCILVHISSHLCLPESSSSRSAIKKA